MSVTKTLVYSFATLALAQQACADEPDQRAGWQFPSFSGFGSGSFGGIDFSNFGGSGSSGSGSSGSGFPGLPFHLPHPPGLGALFSSTTSTAAPSTTSATEESTTASGRKRRQIDESDLSAGNNDHGGHRLFFSRFPEIISCNYTTQAGSTCTSCTESLRCFPNNFGLLITCRGRRQYCNNGRCSRTQSEDCSDGSSTSSSSTSSSTSTSTSSTSTTPSG